MSSASETTNPDDASFSSSTIDGSVATAFSNSSSGRSGSTFLPSGPTTTSACRRRGRRLGRGRLVGRLGRGLLRRLGLRCRLGRGLLGRGLRRLGRRRLLRGRGRDRAHAHRHGDGDAEAGQVRHQRLEVTRLDAGLLGRPTYVVGGHAAGGLRLRDEGLDGGVREHARWRSLARVRGHEHLSSRGFGARQGPLSSRAALRILPRTWWQPRTAGPSRVHDVDGLLADMKFLWCAGHRTKTPCAWFSCTYSRERRSG